MIVDNNSSDHSVEIIQSWEKRQKHPFMEVQTVKRSENHLGKAREQAIQSCKTPWIIFVDGDTQLEWNWSQGLYETFKKIDDNTVGVGGSSYYIPERKWHHWASQLSNVFPLGRTKNNKVVDHVPTNNYLLRVEAVKKAGGFSPLYSHVGEDLDLNIRLRKEGLIYFSNEFTLRHYLPESQKVWFQKMFNYGWAQSVVAINNFGGVSFAKAIPVAFLITLIFSFYFYYLATLLTIVTLMFFPMLRFYFLTLVFYGGGEMLGLIKGFFIKSLRKGCHVQNL